MYSKIARHLEDVHSNESEVASALAIKKGSKERAKALEKIRLKGNYHHNAKVVSSGKGELIVKKRPSEGDNNEVKDYLPCPNCLGFSKKTELWRHVKICPFKNTNEDKIVTHNVISESRMMLLPFTCPKASLLLQESVLAKMKTDDISFLCKHDNLILMFGSAVIEKVGRKNASDVSQRMRQLARLLNVLNEEKDGPLEDFLNPCNFDLVLKSVKKLCQFSNDADNGNTSVATPSLALRLGHHLKKCAQICRGVGLRERNEEMIQNTKHFLELMEFEWSDRISSSSLSTLERNKPNKVELPLASDLELVRKSMTSKISSLGNKLKEKVMPETWSDLAQFTAARMITFNKRRSGEASRLFLKDYNNRPKVTEDSDALMSTLDPLETQLCKRYDNDTGI